LPNGDGNIYMYKLNTFSSNIVGRFTVGSFTADEFALLLSAGQIPL